MGAASFDGKNRYINSKNLKEYLASSGRKASFNREVLTKKDILLEIIMLGLRQKKGVDLHSVLYFLDEVSSKRFLDKIKILKMQGFMIEKNGRFFLTLKGIVLENEIVLNLV